MKKLIVLLIALLFVTGCVGNGLKYITYDSTGKRIVEKIDVSNIGGMNNAKTDTFEMEITTPSGFKTKIKLKGRDIKDSPDSMRAIGDAGANIISAGASGTVKEIVK